jgi:hypothetical protein
VGSGRSEADLTQAIEVTARIDTRIAKICLQSFQSFGKTSSAHRRPFTMGKFAALNENHIVAQVIEVTARIAK